MSDILLVGVGGQGIVLASRLLAEAALLSGMRVRTAETIGMAQRGGCVMSYVRTGETLSPMIPKGCADCIIAFEPGEAVRSMPYLKKGGTVIACEEAIMPVSASLGARYSPFEHIQYLKDNAEKLILVNSEELAARIGSQKSLNIALIAAAVVKGAGGISLEALEAAVKKLAKPQYLESNLKALAAGAALIN